MWDTYRERARLIDERADMEFSARNAMASLMITSGEPTNWHSENFFNAGAIGLAYSDYDLHDEKIQKLENWNSTYYLDIKNKLGIRKI